MRSDVCEGDKANLRAIFDPLQKIVESAKFDVRIDTMVRHDLAPAKEGVNNFLGLVQDELEKSASFNGQLEKRLEQISELLSITDQEFRLFMRKATRIAVICDDQMLRLGDAGLEAVSEASAQILRNVHTFKSHAKLLRLNRVVLASQNFERVLIHVRRTALERIASSNDLGQSEREQLMEDLARHSDLLNQSVSNYQNLRERILRTNLGETESSQRYELQLQWLKSVTARLLTAFKQPFRDVDNIDSLSSEFDHAVQNVGRVALDGFLQRYDQMLYDMSRSLGKAIQPIVLSGDRVFFSEDQMETLNEILLHCLRNAIDHGVESVKKREELNKSPAGQISIHLEQYNSLVKVVIADDGAGINYEKIAKKAVEQQILTQDRADSMPQEEILQLIFATGLSTAKMVTEVSGCGVGMDIVKDLVGQLGGDVSVSTSMGEGTKFTLIIPTRDSTLSHRYSYFDVASEMRQVFLRHSLLLNQRGLSVGIRNAQAQRSIVHNDLLNYLEATKQLTLSLLTLEDQEVEIEVAMEEAHCQVRVVSKGVEKVKKRPELASMEKLMSPMNATLNWSGSDSLEISFMSGMPGMFCEIPLAILQISPIDNLSDHIDGFLGRKLGGWTYQIYRPDEIEAYAKLEYATIPVVVISANALEQWQNIGAQIDLSEAVVIIFSDEAMTIDPDLSRKLSRDPIIVEQNSDPAAVVLAITAALGSAMRRSLAELSGEVSGVKIAA